MLATNVRVTVAPATEPVTATEAKLHLRIDHSDEDDLLDRLIELARQECEDWSRRAFVTRTLRADLDDWPKGSVLQLPYPPLASVTSIQYIDSDGTTNTISSSDYEVDTHSEPGRVYLAVDVSWPSATLRYYGAIQITYTAGYGVASAVPARYKQAMLLMIGHLYENREAVIVGQGSTITEVPMAMKSLLMTDRGSW